MYELDAFRSNSRRCEDLLTLFRTQLRRCEDLFADARAVWSDRAAQRAWQRNVDPQIAAAAKGEEQLRRQAEYYTQTVERAEAAVERLAKALAATEAASSAIAQAVGEAQRAQALAGDAASDAASAGAALAEVQGQLDGL